MTSPSCFEPLVKANTFASLPSDFYTRLPTTPLTAPRLVHASAEVAAVLGLPSEALDTQEFLDVVSGTRPLPGGDTMAAVYSGHQFGVWAGQLGDGRAHLLGEIQGPDGSFEVQLKGAGMTPYSRMGDGRAVLRSSVREYLASHAMRGLGIPTTQALSLVSARNPVRRETLETAAVVARVAPSFIRFGSFEHWAARRRPDLLRVLADYVIDRFYPECRDESARTASVSDSKTSHVSASATLTQVVNQRFRGWQPSKRLRALCAVVTCRGAAHRDAYGKLASGGFLSWGDEYRQHVDFGAHT
jgi:uncharacterized protein YdiU (UPF0061 family)